MGADEREVMLRLVRRVLEPDRPAELVHHFLLVRVGNDILLEAGYLDLAEFKAAIDRGREAGTPVDATLFIGHRLQLSPDTLRQLVEACNEILASLNVPV